MMYVALMDVISELRNSPPPFCTWCLAKLLRDDVITFIKIEPTGEVGPLLQDAVIVQSTARNARSQGPY